MYESRHTCKWVVSQIHICDTTHLQNPCVMCDMRNANLWHGSCCTCVMSHMTHVAHASCMNASCHTYEWVMRNTCEHAMSHIWIYSVLCMRCLCGQDPQHEPGWHLYELCHTFLDGDCSTVQGLLDWFEVDLGFTELLFIQIDLCVMCVGDIFMSYVTRINEFYVMYDCAMSHDWTSYVRCMCGLMCMCGLCRRHPQHKHARHLYETCHTYKRVLLHV